MNSVNIKEFEDGSLEVSGYGVLFNGKDISGDTFLKDVTNFDFDYVPQKRLLYSHGRNQKIKKKIGFVKEHAVDEVGVFFKAELDKAFKYKQAVKRLADLGLLGMSTGTAEQLMDKDETTGVIKEWPLVELSLTVTPMEPRTVGVKADQKSFDYDEALKAIEEFDKLLESDESEEVDAETDDILKKENQDNSLNQLEQPSIDESEKELKPKENKTDTKNKGVTIIMSDKDNLVVDQNNPEFAKELAGFMKEYKAEKAATEGAIKSVSDQLTALLNAVQGNNKLMGAGFVTQDGGTADKHVKSLSDFLMAIRRNDQTRLAKVYGSTKDLSGDVGTAGAYTIPPEFETSLLQVSAMNSNVMSRVKTITANSDSGRWPVLDQYIAPSAGTGQVAAAAGVVATPVTGGQTLTKTEPGFEMLEWRLSKVGGYTEVDNELMADSPMAIEALLTSLFGIAVSAKNERNVLRGTGVGEPLGILNASCVVNVTPATNNLFTWPDVATMFSRFKSAGGSPIWLIHPSRWPDIMKMEIGTGGANAWTANMAGGPLQSLNGYPILMSEHSPQTTVSGSVMLIDLNAYLFWQKPGIQIAFSEHAAFRDDQATWRFTQRVDGKPWLRNPITLADPQGSYTVSPFVNHND